MRILAALCILLALFAGCGSNKKQQPAANAKNNQKSDDPEYLGDPTAPTEIRALNRAKALKQQIENRNKENSKNLDENQ